jgi:hypothetical protein
MKWAKWEVSVEQQFSGFVNDTNLGLFETGE